MTGGEYKAQRLINELGTEGLKLLKAAADAAAATSEPSAPSGDTQNKSNT